MYFDYPPAMQQLYIDNSAQLAQVLRHTKEIGLTTSLETTLPDSSSVGGQVDRVAILQVAALPIDLFFPSIEETLDVVYRSTFTERFRDTDSARR